MSVKYTRIPMEEEGGILDERMSVDYSSPFVFENSEDVEFKYRSSFKYTGGPSKVTRIVAPEQHRACQSLCQKILHLVITVCCSAILVVTFPITIWFSIKKAAMYERVVVFRLGRLLGAKGPGLVFVLPCIDRWYRVDTRMRAFKVPPKQVATADGGIIQIGADVYYRIAIPEKSITNVQNMDRATRVLVETGMQNQLVQKKLAEIESQRTVTGDAIREACNKSSLDWGVELFRVDLSEIQVLRKPPQRSAPTMMFPPGMFGEGAGASVPPVIQQMFSAVMQASGGQQPAQEAAGPVAEAAALPGTADSSEWNAAAFESLPAPAKMNTNTSSLVESEEEGPTPEEMMQLVRCVLCENLVQRVRAIFYFDIIGRGGGQYYLDLKHGSGSAGQGPPTDARPDTILHMSVESMRALFQGKVKPAAAYMSGRLKVEGDLTAAYRLEEVIQRMKEESASKRAPPPSTQPEGATWA